jgi:hypothetical protein
MFIYITKLFPKCGKIYNQHKKVLSKLCFWNSFEIGRDTPILRLHRKTTNNSPKDVKAVQKRDVKWSIIIKHFQINLHILMCLIQMCGLNPWCIRFVYDSTLHVFLKICFWINKGNNKITELRTILQRESKNS